MPRFMPNDGRCWRALRTGGRCTRRAAPGEDYCSVHLAADARAEARARARSRALFFRFVAAIVGEPYLYFDRRGRLILPPLEAVL